MPSEEVASFVIALILSPVLLGVGALSIIALIREMRLAAQSETWPHTTGIVKSSDLVASLTTLRKLVYRPNIVYSYEVDQRNFESSQRVFGDRFSDYDSAQSVVEEMHEGKEVRVFYRPTQPECAVLVPGALAAGRVSQVLRIAFGGACFVVGVWIAVSVVVQ